MSNITNNDIHREIGEVKTLLQEHIKRDKETCDRILPQVEKNTKARYIAMFLVAVSMFSIPIILRYLQVI